MDRSVSWLVALRTIDPPRPPSPPSGPPRGTNGSCLKDDEPRPPCPARSTTRAESTKALLRDDADAPAVLAHTLVPNLARYECEQRVVATQPDPGARSDPGAALAHEDGARAHALAAIDLHAQHLRVGVAAVAGGAAAFLVCHLLFILFRPARRARGLLVLDFGLGLGLGLSFGRDHALSLRLRLHHHLGLLGLAPAPSPAFGRFGLRLFLRLGAARHQQAAHREDLEGGVVGAAAAMDAHALLGLVSQRLDPRATAVTDDLGFDVHALDGGRPDLDLVAVAYEQDAVQLHRRTGLGDQAADEHPLLGRDALLLAAADHDRRQRSIRLGHERRYYRTGGCRVNAGGVKSRRRCRGRRRRAGRSHAGTPGGAGAR